MGQRISLLLLAWLVETVVEDAAFVVLTAPAPDDAFAAEDVPAGAWI